MGVISLSILLSVGMSVCQCFFHSLNIHNPPTSLSIFFSIFFCHIHIHSQSSSLSLKSLVVIMHGCNHSFCPSVCRYFCVSVLLSLTQYSLPTNFSVHLFLSLFLSYTHSYLLRHPLCLSNQYKHTHALIYPHVHAPL